MRPSNRLARILPMRTTDIQACPFAPEEGGSLLFVNVPTDESATGTSEVMLPHADKPSAQIVQALMTDQFQWSFNASGTINLASLKACPTPSERIFRRPGPEAYPCVLG